MDDDLYATSPSSGVSILSTSSNSSSNSNDKHYNTSRKKKKKKNRDRYNQFIREETNTFEIFNNKDYIYNDISNNYRTTESYELIARNKIQEEYVSYLNDMRIPIILSVGAAGTGKTYIACQYAITSYLKGNVDKIIITRPTVSVDEEHGFLPGTLNDKMKPWLRPIYDIFEKYMPYNYLQKLIKEEIIEICPLAFMRGRTFENAIIIADEMQNSTENQMKMILTRISFDSKLIINGDLNQSDYKRNGLKDFLNKYEHSKDPKKENIKIVKFNNNNIQRHSIIETVLNIYE